MNTWKSGLANGIRPMNTCRPLHRDVQNLLLSINFGFPGFGSVKEGFNIKLQPQVGRLEVIWSNLKAYFKFRCWYHNFVEFELSFMLKCWFLQQIAEEKFQMESWQDLGVGLTQI